MLTFTAVTPPPFLQGGFWLKSPTGHPWHPRLPLPFFPRWGNCQWGRRRRYQTHPLHPNPLSAPSPSFIICLPWQIQPLTCTSCRQHVTHTLHLTPQCTFKWQRSTPAHLIFTVNQHHELKDWWVIFVFHIESLDQNTKMYFKQWSKSNNHVLSDAIL